MDDDRTFAQFKTGFFKRGVFELQRCLPDRVAPVRPIRQIDKLRGNLRRKPQDVLCGGAAWLNPPSELACKCLGHLVQVRAKLPTKQFARAWKVVYATDYPANHTSPIEPM